MPLSTIKNVTRVLPVIRFELYSNESIFLIQTNFLNEVLTILKNHFSYQAKILTCILSVDYPENLYRFQLIYELLSIKYNTRTRIKVILDELTPMDSAEKNFSAATWWEREIWDMFGVFFLNHFTLTRLLTDYGFQGHPLRKDFPLSGYIELKYNIIKNRVVYENLELAQEYKIFEFISPWENYKKNGKIINKRQKKKSKFKKN
jgi:NADH:ubiquinone oxidoreductase subunit C